MIIFIVLFLEPHDPAYRSDLFLYSLMPVDVKKPLELEDLQKATQHEPFDFTKGMPVWKIPATGIVARGGVDFLPTETMLFDLENDPDQKATIKGDSETENRLKEAMRQVLIEHDAPQEVLSRYYENQSILTAAI